MRLAGSAWLSERPIAHRGLLSCEPVENSLPAFEACAAAGVPMELDVRLCASGEAVVFHDADLERLTGRPGLVRDTGLQALRRLRLAGGDEPIPTLDEVVALVRGRAPILVELKTEGRPGPLEDGACALLARYDGEAAVQSFNPLSVLYLRRRWPQIVRGQLWSDFENRPDVSRLKRRIASHMGLNALSQPDFIGCRIDALSDRAAERLRARNRRKPLLFWTVRTAAERDRARRLGYNIIFEELKTP